MPSRSATAVAHPNIALIKYWGNRDEALRIPANASISLTLDGMQTRTTVSFEASLTQDKLEVNGRPASVDRASELLDEVRQLAGFDQRAAVESQSDFPAGTGLASSAAAFAALSVAATQAAGLELDPESLSRLARRGSGSAARSILGGYVELLAGDGDAECYAQQVAAPEHWELIDLVAVVEPAPKAVGSTAGHARAPSSPLQSARLGDAPRRLQHCRSAIQQRDFERLAQIAELDSDLMHAVMMTSQPGIHYWLPASVQLMEEVRTLRSTGVPVFYTLDAGPNVHCLCLPEAEARVRAGLDQLAAVQQVFRGFPGAGARLVDD